MKNKKLTGLVLSFVLLTAFTVIPNIASNPTTFSLLISDPGTVPPGETVELTITPEILSDNLVEYMGIITLGDGLTNPALRGGTLGGLQNTTWSGTTDAGWDVFYNTANGRFMVLSPTGSAAEAVGPGDEADIEFTITLTADTTGTVTIDGVEGVRSTAVEVLGSETSREIKVDFVVPPTGIPGMRGYTAAMLVFLTISSVLWGCILRRRLMWSKNG